MKKRILIPFFVFIFIFTPFVVGVQSTSLCADFSGQEQRRGCCSWHGGVCGCDVYTGKQACCDGTLSPTCYCE